MARRYVRVFEEFSDGKHERIRDLSLRMLYELTTLPPDEREQTHETANGEEKKPDEMTVKELRELKRQLKKEKERADGSR